MTIKYIHRVEVYIFVAYLIQVAEKDREKHNSSNMFEISLVNSGQQTI